MHAQLGLGIVDQLAAHVDGHLAKRAGELERARIIRVTGEPGLAPQVRAPGLSMKGVVAGASPSATRSPST